jgi:hypothetical protein
LLKRRYKGSWSFFIIFFGEEMVEIWVFRVEKLGL